MAFSQNSITTLPYEVLGEVFTHYASACPDAPVVIGTVSRLFRNVAYTTPSAWTNLKLSDRDGRSKVALWFEMSKACHMDVQIQMAEVGRTEHGASTPASAPAALETLRFHTDRIASLCLRTGTQAQARAALTAIYSDVAPNAALRSLRISAATLTPGPPLTFPAIPSITDLETTNVALGVLPSLDLAKLQNLRIIQPLISAPIPAADILDLISVAPCLRRLKVDARITDPTGASALEPRFFPQLEELHLRANNIVFLLDHFIVPALRVLHLSDLDGKRADASGDTGTALHRLLVRMELGKGDLKSNELRVFELVGVAVERKDAVWERCAQRMKALEVFTVDSPSEKEYLVQEDAATQPEEPRTRPIKAGFSFGFGAVESDFAATCKPRWR
ncbi:hypothetical protein FB451DRAFT_202746 [Mycena latifolia]|nr:hypothetical protein FB451DRAFT_202746 [Mycena latifolia]